MDADASLDPGSLEVLLRRASAGPPTHLVVGARRPVLTRAWPWQLRFANRVLARRVAPRDRAPTSTTSGRCGWPTRALQGSPIGDRRSGYPLETVLRAAQAGWTVTEVPVHYVARSGRSKVTGTAGHGPRRAGHVPGARS